MDNTSKFQIKHKVPVTDLFTDDFIQRYSKFNSLQDMLKASGYEMKDVLSPSFQIFCTYMTDFHSWETMLKAAKEEYLKRWQIS